MPELPEIETLAADLRRKLPGLTIARVAVRTPKILKSAPELGPALLAGSRISAVARRAKYLFLDLNRGFVLGFHLGMTGQLLFRTNPPGEDRHVHMTIEFHETAQKLVFRDIRKFGKILLTGPARRVDGCGLQEPGPDPFELEEPVFTELYRKRRGKIKSLLLNQRVVAGLGNIYADESLFRAGIDPRRRPHRLGKPRLAQLFRAIRQTLSEAIACGGSSIDDYVHADGGRGGFQELHRVYGRSGERCGACGAVIRCLRIAGRSSFFCPNCQR